METNEHQANARAAASAEGEAALFTPDATRPKQKTHQVMVGNVPLGGGAPVVVQSMLNAQADSVE